MVVSKRSREFLVQGFLTLLRAPWKESREWKQFKLKTNRNTRSKSSLPNLKFLPTPIIFRPNSVNPRRSRVAAILDSVDKVDQSKRALYFSQRYQMESLVLSVFITEGGRWKGDLLNIKSGREYECTVSWQLLASNADVLYGGSSRVPTSLPKLPVPDTK